MNVFVKIDVNPTTGIQNSFAFQCCKHECLLRSPQSFPVFRIAARYVVPHSRTHCQNDKGIHGLQVKILIITSVTLDSEKKNRCPYKSKPADMKRP